jgi:hypothetical protein
VLVIVLVIKRKNRIDHEQEHDYEWLRLASSHHSLITIHRWHRV